MRKIILYGLVLLLLVSLGSALHDPLDPSVTCSDDATDYAYLFETEGQVTASHSGIIVTTNKSFAAANTTCFTLAIINYNLIASTVDKSNLKLMDEGSSNLVAATAWFSDNLLHIFNDTTNLQDVATWGGTGKDHNVTYKVCPSEDYYNFTFNSSTHNWEEDSLGCYDNNQPFVKIDFLELYGGYDEIRVWDGDGSCPSDDAAPPTADNPTVTDGFNNNTYENNSENINITFEFFNLTSSSTADLYYNGQTFAGTINHVNNSYVEFSTTVSAPAVYNNSSTINLNWNYTLQHANATTTINNSSSNVQTVIWNLTEYPRTNISALNLITGSSLTSFTITGGGRSFSTTNGEVFFNYTAGITELSIDGGSGLQQKTENVTFTTGAFNNHTFSLYTHNSINITIKDEQTDTAIANTNFSIEFISDTYSNNYTTNSSDGTFFIDLLSPEEYTIRYSGDDYGRLREYIFTLTNRTHNTLNLYLLKNSNSTETTVTVYDEVTINTIEGAIVYLQRYFSAENVYKTVAMYSSDVAGNSYFDIEHDEEKYKFLVDYPFQTRKLTTNPLYVSETTLNLYLSLLTDATTTFFSIVDIGYTLNYDEVNNEFDLTYTDSELIATNYCLYLKTYGTYAKTTVNSSCTTSSSSSISLQGLTENKTYYAVFTATIDDEETVIASLWKTIHSDKLQSGSLGLFLTAMIVMIAAFVGSLHILSLIFINVALLFAQLTGILSIGWGAVIVVFISSLILCIIIQMKK